MYYVLLVKQAQYALTHGVMANLDNFTASTRRADHHLQFASQNNDLDGLTLSINLITQQDAKLNSWTVFVDRFTTHQDVRRVRPVDSLDIHLTMCFRATAGALVSQASGGRALLQAKGLWLE